MGGAEDEVADMRGLVVFRRLIFRLFGADIVEHQLFQFLRPIAVMFFRDFIEFRDEFIGRSNINHLLHPSILSVKRMYSNKIQKKRQYINCIAEIYLKS